jgi:hypothetical protein
MWGGRGAEGRIWEVKEEGARRKERRLHEWG